MTISVLQYVNGTDSAAAGLTAVVTATFTAGSSAHVFATVDDTFTISSIASSPVASWTSLDAIDDAADGQRCQHWVADNLSGSTTITVTFNSASADFRAISVKEIGGTSGYDAAASAAHAAQLQAAPGLVADQTTSGNTSALSTQPALVSGFSVDINGTGLPAAGGGYTSDGTGWTLGGSARMRGESRRLTATTATSAKFTALANEGHITVAAVFKESSASASWQAIGSDHPGKSPGLGGSGSGRFQTNWWPYSPTVVTDVTVAITGVAGTGSVGSVAVSFDLPPTGVSGTGSVGSVGISNSPALVGVGGTGSVGTVAPLSGVPLVGSTGTGSVGTLAPAFNVALTGNEGASAVGTLTVTLDADVTVALSGVVATSAVGSLTASASGSVEVFSGGYFPRVRHLTEDDRKRRRIELGILPPEEEARVEDAIDLAVESAVALSQAKPETQAATDALQAQQRAQDLFLAAYLRVYPELERQRILEALRLEAHRLVLLQEEEFAIVLSML